MSDSNSETLRTYKLSTKNTAAAIEEKYRSYFSWRREQQLKPNRSREVLKRLGPTPELGARTLYEGCPRIPQMSKLPKVNSRKSVEDVA